MDGMVILRLGRGDVNSCGWLIITQLCVLLTLSVALPAMFCNVLLLQCAKV